MTLSISLSILPSLQEISIHFLSSSSHNAINLLSYSIGLSYKWVFETYIYLHKLIYTYTNQNNVNMIHKDQSEIFSELQMLFV